MSPSVRSMPRWLIVTVIGALLLTVLALSGAGRAAAQNSATATPTATAGATETPTAAATDTAAARDTVTAAEKTGDGVFAVGDSVVVAGGPLNLRDAAGTDSDVVLKLATGTKLTITDGPEQADGYTWYEVQTNADDTGWVAGEFLANGDTAVFAEGDSVEVADGPLNVRDDAGTDAKILTKLQTGDTATIKSGPIAQDGYNWYEVTLNDDSTGWVAGEFLQAVDGGNDSGGTADFAIGDSVKVAVDGMNFRADAGTDAEVLDTLDLNALFIVRDGPISADGYTWYKVFNYYYGEGWVAGELMTKSSTPFPAEEGS